MDGIGFGLAREPKMMKLAAGERADVLFHLDRNEYRGPRSLQLLVQDIAPAGTVRIEEDGDESNASH